MAPDTDTLPRGRKVVDVRSARLAPADLFLVHRDVAEADKDENIRSLRAGAGPDDANVPNEEFDSAPKQITVPDDFDGVLVDAGGTLYILDDDTRPLAGAGPSMAPVPPANDRAASQDEVEQAKDPLTSSAPSTTPIAAAASETTPETEPPAPSKTQLMGMNKDDLIAQADREGVTVDPDATKDVISDAIIAAR